VPEEDPVIPLNTSSVLGEHRLTPRCGIFQTGRDVLSKDRLPSVIDTLSSAVRVGKLDKLFSQDRICRVARGCLIISRPGSGRGIVTRPILYAGSTRSK
jgi:hypothetical protein